MILILLVGSIVLWAVLKCVKKYRRTLKQQSFQIMAKLVSKSGTYLLKLGEFPGAPDDYIIGGDRLMENLRIREGCPWERIVEFDCSGVSIHHWNLGVEYKLDTYATLNFGQMKLFKKIFEDDFLFFPVLKFGNVVTRIERSGVGFPE